MIVRIIFASCFMLLIQAEPAIVAVEYQTGYLADSVTLSFLQKLSVSMNRFRCTVLLRLMRFAFCFQRSLLDIEQKNS